MPNLRRAVFIVGAPRSGTSFLGECFAAVPACSFHFEPVLTKVAAEYVYLSAWPGFVSRFLYRETYKWLMRLRADADLRLVEKTPRHCYIMPFLAHVFPDCQFIHIIRDGRDVALSLIKHPWIRAESAAKPTRDPAGYLMGPYAHYWIEPERREEFEETSDLHRAAWLWRRSTQTTIANAAMLPTNRYLELRYESLVQSPDVQADRILEFLCVRDGVSKQAFHEAVRRARSSSVGAGLRTFSPAELEVVYREAGATLRELQYL
ncbi:MAG: sulfotransferase [Phycisphaerae bacterium]|nr:sulfotransferase [Phycisphaerae bacterium]